MSMNGALLLLPLPIIWGQDVFFNKAPSRTNRRQMQNFEHIDRLHLPMCFQSTILLTSETVRKRFLTIVIKKSIFLD